MFKGQCHEEKYCILSYNVGLNNGAVTGFVFSDPSYDFNFNYTITKGHTVSNAVLLFLVLTMQGKENCTSAT